MGNYHKRILIISNYKESAGGISGQVKLLYNNLLNEGVDAIIFSTKFNILKRFFIFFKLLVIGRKFDVFHIHACSYWGFLPAIYGITVGKILKKKIILTYHGGEAEFFLKNHKRFVRWWLLKTDTNIVLSGFLGKVFNDYNIPYTIIPNILEQDNIKPILNNSISPKFISVRTLQPLYNVMCIVKAFEIVQMIYKNASLTILADGPCREGLEKYVADHNLNNIIFTGFISNERVLHEMQKADILLSAPKIDNQPMSILEAFKNGLVVISSNVGGVPYMIKDGYNGLLFESDNYKELADKMIWILTNQKKAKELISNGILRLRYYSWDNIKEDLFKLYSSN